MLSVDPSASVIEDGLKEIQDHISNWLEKLPSGRPYKEDLWEYKPKGGGRTRVWESEDPQDFLEKGGVNFSCVYGDNLPPASIAAIESEIPEINNSQISFVATGVSLVLHPHNPFVPTIHMNVRYFETESTWWYGGGIDLTPYYIKFENVQLFHNVLKQICERHDQPYEVYKKNCDQYFYLTHRSEERGIGGIFFDYLRNKSKLELLNFIMDLGKSFTVLYAPNVLENYKIPYNDIQREYQLIRRSRYVEFNLIYDRGTKFGLQSKGRIESILMSLPTICKWKYNHSFGEDTIEGQSIRFYLQPHDWIKLKKEDIPNLLQKLNLGE